MLDHVRTMESAVMCLETLTLHVTAQTLASVETLVVSETNYLCSILSM